MVRRLGQGGMAEVFLAVQLSLERQVALKLMSFDGDAADDLAARFEREARTIAKLDHPHIVGIHDVGRTRDGRLYYTMPYLPNGDLAAYAERHEPRAVLKILRALCDALEYAHAHGVVHRDVKPENILFDKINRPQLADFGIALTRDEQHRVTLRGRTLGSSSYMSPEQARGQDLDGRADLYSVGILCYELLTDTLPYTGADALSIALAHSTDPIPRLSPEHRVWQAFIDKALAKTPSERFQSAAEMRTALDHLAGKISRAQAALNAPTRISPRAWRTVAVAAALALSVFALWRWWPWLGQASVADTAAAPDIRAMDAERLDQSLRDAYAAIKTGALFEPPNDNAADRFLALLAVQPANTEALAGLDATLAAAGAQAEQAFARAQGPRAAALYEGAYATAQRSAIADYPAWATFEQRYVAAARSSLQTMARKLDAGNLDALSLALDNAQLNHPEIAELRGKLGALPKPGAALRDNGGPGLVFVRSRGDGAAFALATREVTRGEFAAFLRDSGHAVGKCRDSGGPLALLRRRNWQEPGFTQRDDEPVVCITHDDATAYTQWLSRKTGQRYRLPTADEWLAAARGLGASSTPCRQGNVRDASVSERALSRERYACNDGAPHTATVARYAPNALGIHDLIGNVSEWLEGCAAASGAGGCAARPWAGSSWRDGDDVALAAINEPRAGEPGAPWIGLRVLRELTLDSLAAAAR